MSDKDIQETLLDKCLKLETLLINNWVRSSIDRPESIKALAERILKVFSNSMWVVPSFKPVYDLGYNLDTNSVYIKPKDIPTAVSVYSESFDDITKSSGCLEYATGNLFFKYNGEYVTVHTHQLGPCMVDVTITLDKTPSLTTRQVLL